MFEEEGWFDCLLETLLFPFRLPLLTTVEIITGLEFKFNDRLSALFGTEFKFELESFLLFEAPFGLLTTTIDELTVETFSVLDTIVAFELIVHRKLEPCSGTGTTIALDTRVAFWLLTSTGTSLLSILGLAFGTGLDDVSIELFSPDDF